MENMVCLDPTVDSRWDQFVENHPLGWITHLSGWKKVLEKSFSHMKGFYLALLHEDHRTLKAGLPLFAVKSWLTGKRLISIPFATLCDPLISSHEELEELLTGAKYLMKEVGGSHMEIKFFKGVDFIQNNGLGTHYYYQHHFLVLPEDIEKLRSSLHRTCVRQRIARAYNSKLILREGVNESDMKGFYRLHVKTRRRLGLPPQPFLFFKSLQEEFGGSKFMTLLFAEKNGQDIASIILFKFKDRVSAEFLATDERFFSISPNHFLFWEAIKSAYDGGFRVFDFGRTSPQNETLMAFKKHWGTQVVSLPQFIYPRRLREKTLIREKSISYRMLTKICRYLPDSALRPIGNFCYHHLG
jgi:serine/alanine adding enzyme